MRTRSFGRCPYPQKSANREARLHARSLRSKDRRHEVNDQEDEMAFVGVIALMCILLIALFFTHPEALLLFGLIILPAACIVILLYLSTIDAELLMDLVGELWEQHPS